MSRPDAPLSPAQAIRTDQPWYAGWLFLAGAMFVGFVLGWWLWSSPQQPLLASMTTQPIPTATAGPALGAYPGDLAWEIRLPLLDGGTGTLSEHRSASATFAGHRVLVNFFASWCEPCRAEMPGVQSQAEKHAQHDWIVLGVDVMESRAAARAFRDEFGLTFPILLDETGLVSRLYQATGTPTSLFLDRIGIIVERRLGYMNEVEIAQLIERVP